MSKISIEGLPAAGFSGSQAVPGFPVTPSGHLYLVYEDAAGNEFVIRGGPRNGEEDDGAGPILVEVGKPIERSLDKREDAYGRPVTPEARGSRVLDLGGRNPENVWNVLLQYAQGIQNKQIPYHALGDNSNSAIGNLLRLIGIELPTIFPDPYGIFRLAGIELPTIFPDPYGTTIFPFLGWERQFSFDYEIAGTDGDDILIGGGGAQRFYGGDGDDTLEGGSEIDILIGGSDKDILKGGSGVDFLDGGSGNNDEAIYSGRYAEYDFSYNRRTAEYAIEHKNGGVDSIDYVSRVEVARFTESSAMLFDGQVIRLGGQVLSAKNGEDPIHLSIEAPAHMIDGDIEYKLTLSSNNKGDDKDGSEAANGFYNFAYIIDKSGSMGGGQLAQAKAAYIQLTNALASYGITEENSTFAVIPFNDSAQLLSGPYTPDNAKSQLSSLNSGGGTAFGPALDKAKAFFTSKNATPNAINIAYFLSDGSGSGADTSLQQYADVRAYGIGGGANLTALDIIDSNDAVVLSDASELAEAFLNGDAGGDDSDAAEEVSKVILLLNGEAVRTILPDEFTQDPLGLEGLQFEGTLDGLDTSLDAENILTAQVIFKDGSPSKSVEITVRSGAVSYGAPPINADGQLNPVVTDYAAQENDDKVIGNSQDNIIKGRDGDNKLKGSSGNDTLIAGSGTNDLDGGTGTDIARYSKTSSTIGSISKAGTTTVIGSGAEADTLKGIEYIELNDVWVTTKTLAQTPTIELDGITVGTSGDSTIQGSDADDNINSRDGNDIVDGAAGNDTIEGGNGNDSLSGSDGDDTINGGAGNDTIRGGNGQDTLTGDIGKDRIYGSDGNDNIDGGSGDDNLYGENGNDSLYGNTGNDSLVGGNGEDYLNGDSGNNRLFGQGGNDTLVGGTDNDLIKGGVGNDKLTGGRGDDKLYGGSGDDYLTDYSGTNRLYGQAGNDTLIGGTGNDFLDGGSGHDSLFSGNGRNIIYGRQGTDIAVYNQYYDQIDVLKKLDDAVRVVVRGQKTDTLRGVEHLDLVDTWVSTQTLERSATVEINGTTYGLRLKDTLIGTNEADRIDARAGNDELYGKDGNDTLLGGDGNDRIEGGRGNDTIYGGAGDDEIEGSGEAGEGSDVIYGGDGNDTIEDNHGDSRMYGEAGDDSLEGGDGADILDGGDGNDYIRGFKHDDIIYGGDGDDEIEGSGEAGYGNDTIYGGNGNDIIEDNYGNNRIYGGNGNDTIEAGGYNDYIEGGAGNDYIRAGSGSDVIEGSGSAGAGADIIYGGDGDDIIEDNLGDNRLFGGDGDDNIEGGSGQDYIEGGSGDDYIRAGNEDDRIEGTGEAGFGDDIIYGGAGNDQIEDNHGNNRIYGEQGNDHIEGGNGKDYINGGVGDDRIRGGSNQDRLLGGAGNDWLSGDGNNDNLNGGAGNDVLLGGDGDDFLTGGDGRDELIGGGGRDTYLVEASASEDFIVGFVNDYDTLKLVEGVSYSSLNFAQVGDNAQIRLGSSTLMELRDFNASSIGKVTFGIAPPLPPTVINRFVVIDKTN